MTPKNGENQSHKRNPHRRADYQGYIAHWVYSVFLGLLSVVLGVFSLWPANHFVALLVVAGGLSTVLIYETWRVGFGWMGKAAAAAVFIGIGCIDTIVGPVLPPETEIHGWLQPASDPSAVTDCPERPWGYGANLEDPSRAITVALGRSAMLIPSFGAQNDALLDSKFGDQYPIMTVGMCTAISLTREHEKGVLINADVFTPDGKLAARIRDNEWHVVLGQIAYIERPNRSTLIVHGLKDEELLWVRFLNPRSIRAVLLCCV